MDLRESMRDSVKVFCKGLRVQLATKLFCLETFMVYGTIHRGLAVPCKKVNELIVSNNFKIIANTKTSSSYHTHMITYVHTYIPLRILTTIKL